MLFFARSGASGIKHINILELRPVRLALKHFLPALEGIRVLVLFYINHQGGTRSTHLLMDAPNLPLWALPHLRIIRALHLPGMQNCVNAGHHLLIIYSSSTHLLSRQKPLPGEWTLNLVVVEMIRQRYGVMEVELFASSAMTQCLQYFSVSEPDSLLRLESSV